MHIVRDILRLTIFNCSSEKSTTSLPLGCWLNKVDVKQASKEAPLQPNPAASTYSHPADKRRCGEPIRSHRHKSATSEMQPPEVLPLDRDKKQRPKSRCIDHGSWPQKQASASTSTDHAGKQHLLESKTTQADGCVRYATPALSPTLDAES